MPIIRDHENDHSKTNAESQVVFLDLQTARKNETIS